jgi:hypothetical protein
MDSLIKVILVSVIITGLILTSVLIFQLYCPIEYVMPDGTGCYLESISRGIHHFALCEDGRSYINPEVYFIKYECRKW